MAGVEHDLPRPGCRTVELESWPRRAHCEVFRRAFQGQYCICADVDVTRFRTGVKEKKLPFTLAMIYAIARCANDLENFRYRFQDGEVVLYDEVGTSFAYLPGESDLFRQIHVPMRDTMEAYIRQAREIIAGQTVPFTTPPGNDVFVFSAIPWIAYHFISHTCSGSPEASTPMFDWGRFTLRDGRLWMPLSVQVHHSFVDGIHLSRFYDKLQRYLNEGS